MTAFKYFSRDGITPLSIKTLVLKLILIHGKETTIHWLNVSDFDVI